MIMSSYYVLSSLQEILILIQIFIHLNKLSRDESDFLDYLSIISDNFSALSTYVDLIKACEM